ncbi:hypothetical protein Q5752_006513 [Cryptotrichosporon argae]
MPRASLCPSPEVKPYDRPTYSPAHSGSDRTSSPLTASKSPKSKPAKSDKDKTAKSPRAKGTAWTTDEYLALYAHVTKHGKREWDAAVPGRTANQSYQSWLKTLDPMLKKSVAERAKK